MNAKHETLIQLRELRADGATIYEVLCAVAELAHDYARDCEGGAGAPRYQETEGALLALSQLYDDDDDTSKAPSVMLHLLKSASDHELVNEVARRTMTKARELAREQKARPADMQTWALDALRDAVDAKLDDFFDAKRDNKIAK